MFENSTDAKERASEYYLLNRISLQVNLRALKSLFSFNLSDARDSYTLARMYKRRARRLFTEMKKDCWRCYGTGTSVALQIDLEMKSPICESCGRKNEEY